MKIVLVRHAPALPRGTPGVLDGERPLTSSGRAKFSRAARGLARIVGPVDGLLTSPLTCAQETAAIAAGAFKHAAPVVEPALAGDRADAIADILATCPPEATIVVVGHEPMLAILLAKMLGSPVAERLGFKKGGAALVDLPDGPASTGRLLWFLPPRILRALGASTAVMPTTLIDNGQPAGARKTLL